MEGSSSVAIWGATLHVPAQTYCFHPHSSTLKTETVGSVKTLKTLNHTKWHHYDLYIQLYQEYQMSHKKTGWRWRSKVTCLRSQTKHSATCANVTKFRHDIMQQHVNETSEHVWQISYYDFATASISLSKIIDMMQFTVWAAVDRGVRCTGVRFCTRLSHKTICPEYVPPSTRLGWNLKQHKHKVTCWSCEILKTEPNTCKLKERQNAHRLIYWQTYSSCIHPDCCHHPGLLWLNKHCNLSKLCEWNERIIACKIN